MQLYDESSRAIRWTGALRFIGWELGSPSLIGQIDPTESRNLIIFNYRAVFYRLGKRLKSRNSRLRKEKIWLNVDCETWTSKTYIQYNDWTPTYHQRIMVLKERLNFTLGMANVDSAIHQDRRNCTGEWCKENLVTCWTSMNQVIGIKVDDSFTRLVW